MSIASDGLARMCMVCMLLIVVAHHCIPCSQTVLWAGVHEASQVTVTAGHAQAFVICHYTGLFDRVAGQEQVGAIGVTVVVEAQAVK